MPVKRPRSSRQTTSAMPRRKTKRGKKIRSYRKRRNIVKAPRTVSFAPILQEKVRTWLTYCDTKSLAPGTGSASHVYNLANINDPDYTGVGHQPAFHDQWATYYQKYRVIAAKYTIRFHRALQNADVTDQAQEVVTATGTYPIVLRQPWRDRHILSTELSPTTTFHFSESTDLNFLRETGKKMSGIDWKYGPGPRGTTMSGYVRMKDVMLAPDAGDAATAFNNTPADACYLSVGCMSKNGSDTNAIGFDIKIQFLCELSGQNDVNES